MPFSNFLDKRYIMRLLIPALGDRLKLTSDWEFNLSFERRNENLIKQHIPSESHPHRWNPKQYVSTTLPIDTVLQVDRIYIRKGADDFSSVTFLIVDGPLRKKYNNLLRFWAKLEDVNKIEFEFLGKDVVPKIDWIGRPDYKIYQISYGGKLDKDTALGYINNDVRFQIKLVYYDVESVVIYSHGNYNVRAERKAYTFKHHYELTDLKTKETKVSKSFNGAKAIAKRILKNENNCNDYRDFS